MSFGPPVVLEVTELFLLLPFFWEVLIFHQASCFVRIEVVGIWLWKVGVVNDLVPDQVENEDPRKPHCPSPESKPSRILVILLQEHRQEAQKDEDLRHTPN